MSRDPAFPTASSAPSASATEAVPPERWWGLNPSAVKGFGLWLLIMVFLRSLEKPMGTTWVRLGLPLLDPSLRPLALWNPSQLEVLKWGLAVDLVNVMVYPLVLWSLLNSIAMHRKRRGLSCAKCFRQASWMALLALPCDLAENLCLTLLLVSDTAPSGRFLRFLTVISLIKLACAWVSICWLVLGLVWMVMERFGKSSPGPGSGAPPDSGPSAPSETPASVVFERS